MESVMKQLNRIAAVACWILVLGALLWPGWADAQKNPEEPRPPKGISWGMSEKDWAEVVGEPDISAAVDLCGLPVRVALVKKGKLVGQACEVFATFYKRGLVGLRYEFHFKMPDATQKTHRFRTELRKELWEKYGCPDYPDRSAAILGGSSTWEGKTTTMNLTGIRQDPTRMSSYFSLRYYETPFLALIEKQVTQKQPAIQDEL